jgi:hypothetical protein
MRLDGCNSFVYYGGIIDIVFLVLIFAVVSAKLCHWLKGYDAKRYLSSLLHPVGASPGDEAIPDAATGVELQPHNAPIIKPPQSSGVALPNTEGSFLHLCSMLDCSPPFNS